MTLHPHQCKLREQNGKRSVVFEGANNVERALEIMKKIDELLVN